MHAAMHAGTHMHTHSLAGYDSGKWLILEIRPCINGSGNYWNLNENNPV